MASPIVLELKYTNKEPVALKELTASFNAIASEYRSAQKRTASTFEEDKVELYITDLRKGSIVAELTPLVVAGYGLVENSNAMFDFCGHLRDTYAFVLGHLRRTPTIEKKSVENLIKIVEPIARENGTQLNINAPINIGAGGTFNLIVNTGDAREIKERGKLLLKQMDAETVGTTENVSLFWYQARNEKASTAGDRAVIPDISDKSVKVRFSTDKIKERMLADEANPFKKVYKVDVIVDFKGKKPRIYTITKVRSERHK